MDINSDHRPWPAPSTSWVMTQKWRDLLFAHWPVDKEILRRLVPAGMPLDLYGGRAWIGVVPFRMSGIRLRGTPALPWLSAFAELNVRTYVKINNKPGVYFFSLDAGNGLAVRIARAWFHLPYFHARMSIEQNGERLRYSSERFSTEVGNEANWVGEYEPKGPVFQAARETLDYWLTERYCLYTADSQGRISRTEIHHGPWPLQKAEAKISINSVATAAGVILEGEPLLHFSRFQEVLVWTPQPIILDPGRKI